MILMDGTVLTKRRGRGGHEFSNYAQAGKRLEQTIAIFRRRRLLFPGVLERTSETAGTRTCAFPDLPAPIGEHHQSSGRKKAAASGRGGEGTREQLPQRAATARPVGLVAWASSVATAGVTSASSRTRPSAPNLTTSVPPASLSVT